MSALIVKGGSDSRRRFQAISYNAGRNARVPEGSTGRLLRYRVAHRIMAELTLQVGKRPVTRRQHAQSRRGTVEKVIGIGGLFFRARNPVALSTWYQEHFAITKAPADYNQRPWKQQSGATVFAPFPQDTSYFGNSKKDWMVNFRVLSLDAMVAQLRASGVAVEIDPEQHPNGRFARLYDPEGNPIELWQPEGRDAHGLAE